MPGTRAMGGLGSEHSEPREPNDFYATPAATTLALLEKEKFTGPIWEPACGLGAISKVLAGAGYDVISTDLIERGYGAGGCDFLVQRTLLAPNILTNPPFSEADAFALHALSLGAEKVALFMRTAWVEGQTRHKRLWSRHPPKRMWQFASRQTLYKGNDPNAKKTGGTIAFAWYVWEAGFVGEPTLGWLA